MSWVEEGKAVIRHMGEEKKEFGGERLRYLTKAGTGLGKQPLGRKGKLVTFESLA